MTIETDHDKYRPFLTPDAAAFYAEHLATKFDQGFLAELEEGHLVVWRYQFIDGAWKKPPFDPKTGKAASTTDPATWGTREAALQALATGLYEGLGFVFTNTTKTGIDLDHCIDEQGIIATWAKEIVAALPTYWEYSPSGTGLHGLVETERDLPNRKTANTEIYSTKRYFTLTTNHLSGTPLSIARLQPQLEQLHASLTPPPREKETTRWGGMTAVPRERMHTLPQENVSAGTSPQRTDQEVLEKALHAKNGALFRELWEGRWKANPRFFTNGEPDDSKADWHLLNLLKYWTNGDPAQIERLFQQSSLYRPEKWHRNAGGGHTYGQVTMRKIMR